MEYVIDNFLHGELKIFWVYLTDGDSLKSFKENKPLARLTTEKTQITNIKNRREGIILDSVNIKRIIRKPLKKTDIHDNLNEMGQCFENHKLPNLTQDETENLNMLYH